MGVEPENTLSSFLHAQHAGMDVIELDLHLSKDGALVVMHDADVDRTTDGHGPISAMSLAELRTLDAGNGERVPLFEEVLDAVTAPIQAEIKDVAVARALAEVLNRRDLVRRVEVLSFHDEALTQVSALVPGVRTALVAEFYGPEVVDRAVAAGASAVVLDLQRLTLETVRRAHAQKLRVVGWVVNTPEELRLAHALELDGVTTDFPEIRRTGRFMA
ncbi:glycerophosphoryl diester phosphodiesterase [Streptomyces spiroverticillatus]|uniref:Glycerophosphoryl diester phosphodiesterase n=2 Tax=Streptomyces finlayi TaxID=67296 RepID=A0A918X427_9ACTN|nr:glycerophosphoryl diester phosphodiesterase [Streptomyces spiroverticillatus]GHD10009.1 glycerophosphoryl diester phosphodiesterase [Streptomyces finlayi]